MEKCTKNKSSHSQLYGPLQECGLASFSCCYVIVAPPSHYAISSIDGSSQSQPYGALIPILVAETIVQECVHARFARFYVTVASPSHYTVSSIDGFSQSYLYDFPKLLSSTEFPGTLAFKTH
ncbi:hypothetical protein IGI04_000303 [Brassica rapa subsp. trilocularis]|uniref:Uncharacterized protein n=1 Tax=Brassica rapa subsp. trilocularis TaxID=1813537 RepID=A0ABQ7NQE0_BRACM|nr:hypothetical protein IGI04_000303 [Brassica rapa subsp. trilocularis]